MSSSTRCVEMGSSAEAGSSSSRISGFTTSAHEECAVEEAVRIAEAHGGSTTVLTLGPPEAAEQLRNAMAMGVGDAILLQTDGDDWEPEPTAVAIAEAVRAHEMMEAGRTIGKVVLVP